MRTMRWPLAAVALIALSLIGAGCGSGASTSTDGKSTSTREKALRFSACMRDNGVKQFPDPDASGQLTIDGVVNGSSLDTSSPVWTKAMDACRDLQPSGFTGRTRNAEEQETALRFAQCIRDHGVKDFPDPTKGSPLVDTRRIPSASTSDGITILNAAMQKCRALGQAAIGDQ